MKATIAILAGCALAASAAVHHHKGNASGPGGTSDQAFVNFVAQTDMAEANLGQLAQERAGSQAVKDYAQMVVTDHTADYSKIGTLASKAGLNVPKALDAQHIRMSAPLRKLKGVAFDRQYAHMMVTGHEGAIAAYNKEARDGKNADLKAYAQATIATLEKHESGAKDLVKSKK